MTTNGPVDETVFGLLIEGEVREAAGLRHLVVAVPAMGSTAR